MAISNPTKYESFKVHTYTREKLKELLISQSKSNATTIESKQHYEYLNRYLTNDSINAKTIVVEFRYVDHDFLEDYSAYYVRCFRDLERKCCRLHFFSEDFIEEDFKNFLSAKKPPLTKDILDKHYLGFFVIKPLPKTVIGKTCLKSYGGNTPEYTRHFPITRRYPVNLFGIDLSIKTLAFQEQDRVAAACATSALWCVFQGTGKLFQHAIPSPIEITKSATHQVPVESRVIPSVGLNPHQMAQAVRDVGLEPLTINAISDDWLKVHIYAYMKGKIPLLLGFSLYEPGDNGSEQIGKHAVAVTGYSLRKDNPIGFEKTNFLLRACRVDRIFVHDDQIGPFAKMEFDKKQVTVKKNNKKQKKDSVRTSWKWKDKTTGKLVVDGRAVAPMLLAPLYNKIRIPYHSIHAKVFEFNEIITEFIGEIEWDIYLSTANDFKTSFLANIESIDPELSLHVLTKRMPRYIWVCKAISEDDRPLFELLFDTTGLEQGNLFLRAIEYDDNFSQSVRQFVESKDIIDVQNQLKKSDILKWFNTHDRIGVRYPEESHNL